MATGDIIKQKREDMGITQDDLALSLGVAQSYISAISAPSVCQRQPPPSLMEALESSYHLHLQPSLAILRFTH